jgi:hypothetical protein
MPTVAAIGGRDTYRKRHRLQNLVGVEYVEQFTSHRLCGQHRRSRSLIELELASGEFALVKEVPPLGCTWLMKDRCVARPSPWRP